ncbi:MAG: protein phosphatase 2C domain-containing protein [Rhodoluna sp.]|nr:protein phosphatase 2C domain-containing protein [Rhodoluna sp.]
MAIKTVSFAASDIGRVRSSNQDSGYAGVNLFFVADGMGGHAGGDIASAIASQHISLADEPLATSAEAEQKLIDYIYQAKQKIDASVKQHPAITGMGTTLSAMMVTGTKVTIAHIGDSRIYLARDGVVKQITTDHTFVQRLVDTGRITEEEALVHPRRSVLMRVLGDIEQFPEVEIDTYETKPGDRWMACSDGLSGVVPDQLMKNILLSNVDIQEAGELLVGEALEFGAPDNVTVVLVDVIDAKDEIDFSPGRVLVGSAANEVVIEQRKGLQVLRLLNPLTLLELLQKPEDPVSFAPESEELLEKILKETKGRVRARRFRQIATYLLLIAIASYGLFLAIEYTQTRYFVALNDGYVVIFKGIKEELGPFKFSSVYEVTGVSVDSLTDFQREALERSITAESPEEAQRIVSQLGGE